MPRIDAAFDGKLKVRNHHDFTALDTVSCRRAWIAFVTPMAPTIDLRTPASGTVSSVPFAPHEKGMLQLPSMKGRAHADVRRGKKTITTAGDRKAPSPLGKGNREFRVSRSNALWLALHLVKVGLRGFRDRSLCSAYRGLEGHYVGYRQLRPRSSGTGDPSPPGKSGFYPTCPLFSRSLSQVVSRLVRAARVVGHPVRI